MLRKVLPVVSNVVPKVTSTYGMLKGLDIGLETYIYRHDTHILPEHKNSRNRLGPPSKWRHIVLPVVFFGCLGRGAGNFFVNVSEIAAQKIIAKSTIKQAIKRL